MRTEHLTRRQCPCPPGSRIGLYDVIGALGAGGMGEAYRARDARLGRDVLEYIS